MAVHGHGGSIVRFSLPEPRHTGIVSTAFPMRSTCSPLLKGLKSARGRLNGPGSVLFMPSGNSGRFRNPKPLSLKAIDPLSPKLSALARATYDPKPAAVNFAP